MRLVDPRDYGPLLAAAEAAAEAGGAVVRAEFGAARGDVRSKGPGDWVSEVDTRSEDAIRESLARAVPGVPCFGEEAGGERADVGWLVDPLDGTANFLHGLPAVGVSVALVEHGRPVVGAVHAPLLGDRYAATRGGGTTRNGVPVGVSARPPAEAICATGFPFRHKGRLEEFLVVFTEALRRCEDLRRLGGASLDLAWTACGSFDGYFELSLGPWDVAAGALLVREAGGVVTDWAGDPDAWLASGDILAGPPAVHALLLELAAAAGFGDPPAGKTS